MQFTDEDKERVFRWVYYGGKVTARAEHDDDGNPILIIRTLEGDMKADIGDYIIKGVQGEFYPCKPGIFHATYEQVGD